LEFELQYGEFSGKTGWKTAEIWKKTLKKRDFPMESLAPLLQRYNFFRPKARNVKTAQGKQITPLSESFYCL